MILRWLELKGEDISLLRDEHGEPKAIAINLEVVDSIQTRATPLGGTLVEIERTEPK
jgi:hypothetical protein